MSRHRHSRRKSRSGHRKGSRRAKRSQSRRGIRASARGFRKMKRRGRTRVTGRTFRKLRRHAKNPRLSKRSRRSLARGNGYREDFVWLEQAMRKHGIRPSGRGRRAKNPGGVYHRQLRDGSKVTVRDDGSVTVHDESGREYDSYHIKPYEVSRFLKDLGHGRHANKGHYRYDDMHGEYQTLSRNPRHRRGRGRSRRNCGGSMRNPAQFPMPFVSAMNPRRRGKGRRKMRTRRNHPISRRDARSMKRVLRQHKYKCR